MNRARAWQALRLLETTLSPDRHALVPVACLLIAGCIGFDATSPVLDAHDAPPTPDASVDAPRGYRAVAVRFETAANDYLWTGDLTDTTRSPRGTYSAWLRFHAGDGAQQMLTVAQLGGIGGVVRTSANRFRFLLLSCTGATLLDMETEATYTTAAGWIHVLASWDVSLGRAQLYINGVADRALGATVNGGNICYDSVRWGIGGVSSSQLDADVADLYAALGTSIDLDALTNRLRFRTAAGDPVDLGTTCQGPTGVTPTGCFVGDVATWRANRGTGQGFTLEGNGLSLAPTSPSD